MNVPYLGILFQVCGNTEMYEGCGEFQNLYHIKKSMHRLYIHGYKHFLLWNRMNQKEEVYNYLDGILFRKKDNADCVDTVNYFLL